MVARTPSTAKAPVRTARVLSAKRSVRKERVSGPTLASRGAQEEAPPPAGTVMAQRVERAALGWSSAETHRLATASCVMGDTCSRGREGGAQRPTKLGGHEAAGPF